MAKKKLKFVCPKCGGNIQLTTTITHDIDPETGFVDEYPTVDRDLICMECSNDEGLSELGIIAINITNNKI